MNAWLVGIWKAAAEARAAIVAKMQAEAQAKADLPIPAHEKAAAEAKVVILDSTRQCEGTGTRLILLLSVAYYWRQQSIISSAQFVCLTYCDCTDKSM